MVYVAAEVRSLDEAVDEPSDHVYESAPLAVTLMAELVHVTTVEELVSLLVTLTDGAVLFSVMVISAVEVHPLLNDPVTV